MKTMIRVWDETTGAISLRPRSETEATTAADAARGVGWLDMGRDESLSGRDRLLARVTPAAVQRFAPHLSGCLDWEARTFRFPVVEPPGGGVSLDDCQGVGGSGLARYGGGIELTHALLRVGWRGNAYYDWDALGQDYVLRFVRPDAPLSIARIDWLSHRREAGRIVERLFGVHLLAGNGQAEELLYLVTDGVARRVTEAPPGHVQPWLVPGGEAEIPVGGDPPAEHYGCLAPRPDRYRHAEAPVRAAVAAEAHEKRPS